MKIFKRFVPEIEKILRRGGVGVIPTDTIYGIVGRALSEKTVLRIYRLRRRKSGKPMIILLGSFSDLRKFGIKIDSETEGMLEKFWPGKVSIVLYCPLQRFFYLHRGTKTLAFRLPAKKNLRSLLKKTGPLVAPSANLEGKPPAKTIKEAQKYFGDKVDFYVDAGKIIGQPSTLIKLDKGKILGLRKGAAMRKIRNWRI